jgi:iron complex outermembrane receptor protein
VNASLVKNKDWSWDLSVNGTFLHNKVSDMPSPILTGWLNGGGTSFTSVEVIQNGLPMNAFYTRKFLGLDKNTGFSLYQDDGNTYYYVGNPNPSTLAGFSTTLRYKKFSLGLNMYGSFGQDVFYNTLLNVINVGKINVGGNIALSIYQDPVKESVANPVIPSSRFILKGNYFKLSNMTLAYDFGRLGKAFKEARIYITGQNLFIITNYPGFDPEANFDINNYSVPSLGIDFAQYPTARTIVIGINFSL